MKFWVDRSCQLELGFKQVLFSASIAAALTASGCGRSLLRDARWFSSLERCLAMLAILELCWRSSILCTEEDFLIGVSKKLLAKWSKENLCNFENAGANTSRSAWFQMSGCENSKVVERPSTEYESNFSSYSLATIAHLCPRSLRSMVLPWTNSWRTPDFVEKHRRFDYYIQDSRSLSPLWLDGPVSRVPLRGYRRWNSSTAFGRKRYPGEQGLWRSISRFGSLAKTAPVFRLRLNFSGTDRYAWVLEEDLRSYQQSLPWETCCRSISDCFPTI